ncbi:hypothetical protein ACJJTC_006372 [Scirpophaga incertulas]
MPPRETRSRSRCARALKMCEMVTSYRFVKTAMVTFKLDTCCWFAPVRVGILILGYLNIMLSLIAIVGTANSSIAPTIVKVQQVILEDYPTVAIPILAYSTELAFYVLLLAAMYRKDIVLLRVFMYYCIVAVVSSILVYSMVIPAIDVLLIIAVIASIVFQFYMLVLVRSAIVEIKAEIDEKNGRPPKEIVFSTILKDKNEVVEANIEVPLTDPELEPDKEVNKGKDTKLETVVEHVNEVTAEVESK